MEGEDLSVPALAEDRSTTGADALRRLHPTGRLQTKFAHRLHVAVFRLGHQTQSQLRGFPRRTRSWRVLLASEAGGLSIMCQDASAVW